MGLLVLRKRDNASPAVSAPRQKLADIIAREMLLHERSRHLGELHQRRDAVADEVRAAEFDHDGPALRLARQRLADAEAAIKAFGIDQDALQRQIADIARERDLAVDAVLVEEAAPLAEQYANLIAQSVAVEQWLNSLREVLRHRHNEPARQQISEMLRGERQAPDHKSVHARLDALRYSWARLAGRLNTDASACLEPGEPDAA